MLLERREVLNAFRHQRREHKDGLGDYCAIVLCSTPFGINGGNTAIAAAIAIGVTACSTPFGINGGNTITGLALTEGGGLCSTPFGINGGNTKQTLQNTAPVSSAQRLSASTEGTLEIGSEPTPEALCSTPFGINGGNTRLSRAVAEGDRRSAQRLSASTEGTLIRRPTFLVQWNPCSTPFGINGGNTYSSRATE